MSERKQDSTQKPLEIPPVDPRLLAAMYGMPPEEEIDLLEYWRVIWKNRVFIVAVALGVGILAALGSLLMPNIYRAEVLLAPVSDDSSQSGGLSAALGGLGGLASLAGISLPSGGNTEENLAVLTSRDFLWRFIREQKLMLVLFEDDWDAVNKRWREDDPEAQPTEWDAYRLFTEDGLLSVSTDKDSGLVTLAIEWKDAELAAQWANALVERLNDYLRQRAIAESKANLQYLNRELDRTQTEDVRKALFELISQEQKKAMLANTRVQFAFRVLDPAQPPDEKARPERILIVVLSMLASGFLAAVFVAVREGIRNRKETSSSVDS
ncbi:MAG: hypothetical protein D6698_11700 [Gammaproteobacteria bacterium]|nr:MAG: hypothetical protein D6698_11700 [Gammaproteobacteria bacterium]